MSFCCFCDVYLLSCICGKFPALFLEFHWVPSVPPPQRFHCTVMGISYTCTGIVTHYTNVHTVGCASVPCCAALWLVAVLQIAGRHWRHCRHCGRRKTGQGSSCQEGGLQIYQYIYFLNIHVPKLTCQMRQKILLTEAWSNRTIEYFLNFSGNYLTTFIWSSITWPIWIIQLVIQCWEAEHQISAWFPLPLSIWIMRHRLICHDLFGERRLNYWDKFY